MIIHKNEHRCSSIKIARGYATKEEMAIQQNTIWLSVTHGKEHVAIYPKKIRCQ